MSFRLVPKSVIVTDPERRNGRYCASLHWMSHILKLSTWKLSKLYTVC